MHAPPDLKCERAPLAGRPVSQNSLPCTDITTEAASAYQDPSLIEIQIFCLARRCALSAPMATAIAPIIWGWRS